MRIDRRQFAKITAAAAAAAAIPVGAAGEHASSPADIRIVPGMPAVKPGPLHWHTLILIRSHSGGMVVPDIEVENARLVGMRALASDARPAEWQAFLAKFAGNATDGSGTVHVTVGGIRKSSPLPLGLNLRCIRWERASTTAVSNIPADSCSWTETQLPAVSSEKGVTWLRAHFHAPPVWSGHKLHLHLRAIGSWGTVQVPVVTVLLNGAPLAVSRCTGIRDLRPTYELPKTVFHPGAENTLLIALEHSGITLADAPFAIVAGNESVNLWPFAEPVIEEEAMRAPAGPVSSALPLRPMEVRNGVLRYVDGGEVALWGTNCYPQSYTEYEALKKLGVDPRDAVRQNLDDFTRLGINIVRVHVFDREISDSRGNLVRNDHLDVLDYLIAECSRRGIYLMMTPIAWWWSPGTLADSFSNGVPKQALPLWPEMWPAQTSYIRQLLTHVNPHSGKRLVDEPCLALFEVINEPEYWNYRDITSGNPRRQYELTPQKQDRGVKGVQETWAKFIPDEEWRTPEVFAFFRYNTLLNYVNTMIAAIRRTGARQPVAYSSFFIHEPEIAQAVADSRCEAVTLGAYPGGLESVLDQDNLLGKVWNDGDAPDLLGPLDARFAKKARLVYEFDAGGMLRQVIMYPYLAQLFRRIGVQVACQFQYDTKVLAAYNQTWPQHYLNAWHTPEKMVSFLIGGEVFRRFPRGATFKEPLDEMIAPPLEYCFSRNVSILCAPDCYMQTGASDWHPIAPPHNPARIISVGSCPYFEYGGNGIVDMEITGDIAIAQIYPSVERPQRELTGNLQIDMTGTQDKPLTVLQERQQVPALRMPGWKDLNVDRLPDGITVVRKLESAANQTPRSERDKEKSKL